MVIGTPCSGPDTSPRANAVVGRMRRLVGPFQVEPDDRVDRSVEAIDAVGEVCEHFARRDLAGAQPGCERAGGIQCNSSLIQPACQPASAVPPSQPWDRPGTLTGMGLLGWIVVGLIAGGLARWIVKDERTGCIYTMVIGVLGALIGGGLMSFIDEEGVDEFSIRGIVVAALGAVLLLLVLQALAGRRDRTSRR